MSLDAPKNMWNSQNHLLFCFTTEEAFSSQKMVANRIMRNPRNIQATKCKLPKCPSKLTVKQQVIHLLQIPFTHIAPIHQEVNIFLCIASRTKTATFKGTKDLQMSL